MYELDLIAIVGCIVLTLIFIPIVWSWCGVIEENIKKNPRAKNIIIFGAMLDEENRQGDKNGDCIDED